MLHALEGLSIDISSLLSDRGYSSYNLSVQLASSVRTCTPTDWPVLCLPMTGCSQGAAFPCLITPRVSDNLDCWVSKVGEDVVGCGV